MPRIANTKARALDAQKKLILDTIAGYFKSILDYNKSKFMAAKLRLTSSFKMSDDDARKYIDIYFIDRPVYKTFLHNSARFKRDAEIHIKRLKDNDTVIDEAYFEKLGEWALQAPEVTVERYRRLFICEYLQEFLPPVKANKYFICCHPESDSYWIEEAPDELSVDLGYPDGQGDGFAFVMKEYPSREAAEAELMAIGDQLEE